MSGVMWKKVNGIPVEMSAAEVAARKAEEKANMARAAEQKAAAQAKRDAAVAKFSALGITPDDIRAALGA